MTPRRCGRRVAGLGEARGFRGPGRKGGAAVTCDQCDARVNEGDAFCGECGAFLDWNTSPRPAPPAGAEPEPDPGPAPGDASRTVPAAPASQPDAGPAPDPASYPTPGRGGPDAGPGDGSSSTDGPSSAETSTGNQSPAPGHGSAGADGPAPAEAGTGNQDHGPGNHSPGTDTAAPGAGTGNQDHGPGDHSPATDSPPPAAGGAGDTARGPDPSDAPGTAPEDPSSDPGRGPDTESGAEVGKAPADPPEANARAAALLAPAPTGTPRPRARPRDRSARTPASPSEPAGRPVAVPPGREAVRSPQVRPAALAYTAAPDDVACSACGTANPAGRSFCRRCGVPLRPRDADARLSWWRRLLRRLSRRRRSRRRGPAGRFRRPLTRLTVLAAVAGLVLASIVYGPRILDRVRERFTDPVSVRPAAVESSSSAADHPADLAVDGAWNRFWAPATDREPAGQWLEASFETDFRLTELVVHSGSSDRTDEFLTRARPASLTVTAWNRDGEQVDERTVTLEDRAGEQVVDLTMDDVASLRLTIRSVYGYEPTRLVALGEVEFFTRD